MVFGSDQEMARKWLYNLSTGLILVAFYDIFRLRPVGRGRRPEFGRKPAQTDQTRIIFASHTYTHFYFCICTTRRVFVDVPDGPHIDEVAQGGLAAYLVIPP